MHHPCIISTLALCLFATLSGCAGDPGLNPNILARSPYNQITYISEPGDEYWQVNTVQATTRGRRANLINTMLSLYQGVLKSKGFTEGARYITDIKISSYTKRELYPVPYHDCQTEPYNQIIKTPRLAANTGTNRKRSSHFHTKTKFREVCKPGFKDEMRDVLYQHAEAIILEKL
jgi:hypothetical protein